MINWTFKTVDECISKKSNKIGKLKTKDILLQGKYAVIDQSQNFIAGYSNESELLYKGDLPLVIYGDHTNSVKFIDFDFIQGADGIKILVPNKDIDSKYFFYAITNFKPENQGYRRHYSILKNVVLPIPHSLETQKLIATKLDNIFINIDKSIFLLEENLKHSNDLLLSVLDEQFNNLKYDNVVINSLIEKTKNINPIKEFEETEFTYIDITSINNKSFVIENPKILKGKEAPSRAKKEVLFGDIVFATTRPNLKNIAIVNEDYINPIASTGFCVLRVDNSKILNEYLFYYLTSQKVQELINPFIKGAQYPAISDKDLVSIEIPLPYSIEEQKYIVNKIKDLSENIYKMIDEINSKIDNLKALKESILNKAFKGELV